MEKKHGARCVKIISLCLAVTLLSLSITPSSFSREANKTYPIDNLATRLMASPIGDETIKHQGELGVLIMYTFERDPSEVISNDGDMVSGDYTLHFSRTRKLGLKDVPHRTYPAEIYVIPCSVGDYLYYAYLIKAKDQHPVVEVAGREDHVLRCKKLFESKKLSNREIDYIQEELLMDNLDQSGAYRYLDISDESVRTVRSFLKEIKMGSTEERLKNTVRKKKLLIVKGTALASEGVIVVDQSKDTSERSISILARLLADRGVPYPVACKFETAFKEFVSSRDSFDLGSLYPEIVLFVRELESGREGASNEGSIKFTEDRAISQMTDVEGVELSQCNEVKEDIIRIYGKVAKHLMTKHNELVWDERYKMRESGMPGASLWDIYSERISECFLPTTIIKRGEKDGRVKIVINENFLKLMYRWKEAGLHGKRGRIFDYPEKMDSESMGDLYESIIYSIAFHDIKGHFRINEWGFAVFNPDEFSAQGERGGGHLYVNTLAMLFYWLYGVERASYPEERAISFMKENPHLFERLTPAERRKLPDHLLDLCSSLWAKRRVELWVGTRVKGTGMKEKDVQRIITEASEEMLDGKVPDTEETKKQKAKKYSPAEVLKFLYSQRGPFTALGVAEKLGTDDHSMISWALDVLGNMDILKRKEVSKRKIEYEVLPVKSDETRQIQKSLEENEIFALSEKANIGKARGEIYGITQRRWGHALMNFLFENKRVVDLKRKGQKIILTLEADWIPPEQRVFIQDLVQELGSLMGGGVIEVVRTSASGLTGDLKQKIKEMEGKGISREDIVKNIVVLASEDTIEKNEFLQEIKGRAFMAGVDSSKLEDDSFIRLIEMVTMALKGAFEQKLISQNPNIEVKYADESDKRTVTFIPRAEKVDPWLLKNIYDIQKKLLFAA